jgi:hypothetical protein
LTAVRVHKQSVASDSNAVKAWRGVYSRGGGLSTLVQRGKARPLGVLG